MSALSGEDLRRGWIADAERLDRLGHFAKYSAKQRAEVVRKGYLGAWAPDQGIRIARKEVELGYAVWTQNYIDDMRDFSIVGREGVRETTLFLLDEVPPESYEPPCELEEPPGSPFIFHCRILGCEVYFKFQTAGIAKSPRVLFWSCHPPKFKRK